MGVRDSGGALRSGTRGRLPVIAIDGPAGAGKSTLARRVAQSAQLVYVDSGAMYRAVACAVLDAGFNLEGEVDAEFVAQLAQTVDVRLVEDVGGQRVWLGGVDVTARIRDAAVERLVPRVARLAAVRQALIPQQRLLAAAGGVVMDGRDIGTTVLPDADYKFFVTAAFPVRVERRHRQLRRKGEDVSRLAVARDLHHRDVMDTTRSIGRLVAAPDAIRLDTTHMPIEEAVALVLARCDLPDLREAGLARRAGEPSAGGSRAGKP